MIKQVLSRKVCVFGMIYFSAAQSHTFLISLPGGYLLVKGQPCRIVEIHKSKTGKVCPAFLPLIFPPHSHEVSGGHHASLFLLLV
jgi:hypothetical protein